MEAQYKENGKKAGKRSKCGLSVGALNQPEGLVGQIHLQVGVEEAAVLGLVSEKRNKCCCVCECHSYEFACLHYDCK